MTLSEAEAVIRSLAESLDRYDAASPAEQPEIFDAMKATAETAVLEIDNDYRAMCEFVDSGFADVEGF